MDKERYFPKIKKSKIQSLKPEPFKKEDIFANPSSSTDCHLYSKPATCFHRHVDYYEFSLMTRGDSLYYSTFTDKKVLVSENDLIFTRIGESHIYSKSTSDDPMQINISIDKETFEQMLISLDVNINVSDLSSVCKLSKTTKNYLMRLSNKILCENNEKYSSYLIKHWIRTALVSMNKFSAVTGSLMSDWFKGVLSYMDKPSSLGQKLNDLMKNINCSPTTLNKYFRQYFNKTPNEYFTEKKLIYAKRLLLNTDYSIIDISLSVGFDSLSYFNHVFKERFGVSPYVYRKQRGQS